MGGTLPGQEHPLDGCSSSIVVALCRPPSTGAVFITASASLWNDRGSSQWPLTQRDCCGVGRLRILWRGSGVARWGAGIDRRGRGAGTARRGNLGASRGHLLFRTHVGDRAS